MSRVSSASSTTLSLENTELAVLDTEGPDFYIRTLHKAEREIMKEYIKLTTVITNSLFHQTFPPGHDSIDVREELTPDKFDTEYLEVKKSAARYTSFLVNHLDAIEKISSRWPNKGNAAMLTKLKNRLDTEPDFENLLYTELKEIFDIEFHLKFIRMDDL